MGHEFDQLEIIADFINTHDKRMRYEGDPGVELLQSAEDLRMWLLSNGFILEQDTVSEEDLVLARELRGGLRAAIPNNIHDHQGAGFQALNRVAGQYRFFCRFGETADAMEPVDTQGRGGWPGC